MRADARQASRADIALAGGTGRGSPANHRSSVVLVMMWSREELAVEARSAHRCMLSRSPCLWMGTLVAVKRARCRVRWCAEAEGIQPRASGAGGAQMAEGTPLHLSDGLGRSLECESAAARWGVKTRL